MKKLVSFTIMALLLVSAAASLNAVSAQGYQVRKIWSLPMATDDVALSKDGSYVAAVNDTGLYYFPESNSAPSWWYPSNAAASETFLSVAISANGEYVIVGNNTVPQGPQTDSIYYFGNSTIRSGQQASNSYNWTSSHFFGFGLNVERGTIDISANGQYVVVGGSGDDVYYFDDCISKSGVDRPWSWVDYVSIRVTSVDLSPDGNYIAVGGASAPGINPPGFVAFYVNATNAQHQKKWENSSLDGIFEVEVSDDGYAVAAVSVGTHRTLYYWADATSLSGSPAANWTREHDFTSVDMSSDGDKVVAGYEQLNIASLHYWDNAKIRTGADEPETWIDLQTLEVRDVTISNDGNIIAATTYNVTSSQAEVYFFTSTDTFIASFPLLSQDDHILSMSGDGQTVAVGGGTFDSLSLYSLTGTTPIAVGGYDATPNYLVVFLGLAGPWIIAAVASAVAIVIVLKGSKTRRRRRNMNRLAERK